MAVKTLINTSNIVAVLFDGPDQEGPEIDFGGTALPLCYTVSAHAIVQEQATEWTAGSLQILGTIPELNKEMQRADPNHNLLPCLVDVIAFDSLSKAFLGQTLSQWRLRPRTSSNFMGQIVAVIARQ